MQIIQSIRDKGAAIVIVVIALSLIGFILMDARQGSNNMFNSLSSKVGKVNGEAIELGEYNKRVQEAEDMQEQRTGQRPTGTQIYQMRDQMWNQMVAEKIFFAEANKLGIDFTSKELSSILLSNDQSNPLLQERGMLDSITGKLDVSKAQQALANIKKSKGAQRDMINAQVVDPLRLSGTVAKYSGLLNASVYYPTWMKEKDTKEAKEFATISYVSIPYTEISDSTVKVTDADINDYVSKHKDMFKQEEGRYISYISFSSLASSEDSARVLNSLNELKASFQADSNARAFVSRNASVIDFSDDYQPKSKISSSVADTLTKLSPGAVFGPYQDKGNFVLAKMLGSKSFPDSVNARHILFGFSNPQTGQPLYDDSTAKKKADSVLALIKGGANFAALAAQFSSDGSKDKGGDLGTFGYGTMVPEFNDFCFNKPTGSLDVVRTQFGYHIVEVMSQKGFSNAYKIAYLAREISASDVTINKASLDATKASAEKTAENLAKYAAKNGLRLTEVPTLIKENDYNVGALQDARQLVRWAFEAKKGDVSEPFAIGDQYIVAQLDKTAEKGVQDAAAARTGCEVIIRNKKKAALIIQKIGKTPTLESAAAAYNKTVLQAGADSSITMGSQFVSSIGVEPKLIGASFNKALQGKVSAPIEGTSAVYLIRVDGYGMKPADTEEQASQQVTNRKNSMRGQINGWYESLRKLADIKDSRSKFF
jgi:peptidyl-prolyl cis-trans isomerase D